MSKAAGFAAPLPRHVTNVNLSPFMVLYRSNFHFSSVEQAANLLSEAERGPALRAQQVFG
jgi:hypothetical protein